MKQLSLPFLSEQDETSLKNYFREQINKPVLLTITDNSTSVISVREKNDGISLRLHWFFLKADSRVLDEVVEFIKKKGGKTPAIRNFIRQNQNCLKERKPLPITASPKGKYYDLADIFDSLNREYFNNHLSVLITWGKRSPKYSVKNRTLGSYQENTNIIRINPALDRKRVPLYFIEFIVYHEMLHADIGTEQKNGRRVIHSAEFKRREKFYKNYERAANWDKISLSKTAFLVYFGQ
jgi:predicted metal-dependent hydrolase